MHRGSSYRETDSSEFGSGEEGEIRGQEKDPTFLSILSSLLDCLCLQPDLFLIWML